MTTRTGWRGILAVLTLAFGVFRLVAYLDTRHQDSGVTYHVPAFPSNPFADPLDSSSDDPGVGGGGDDLADGPVSYVVTGTGSSSPHIFYYDSRSNSIVDRFDVALPFRRTVPDAGSDVQFVVVARGSGSARSAVTCSIIGPDDEVEDKATAHGTHSVTCLYTSP